MIIPKRLKKGDRIGVVTPSAPLNSNELVARLNNGIAILNDMGFEVVLGRNAMKVNGYLAGEPVEKAEDINEMFADRNVSAILCSQGGGTANSCLPHLDWDTIRKNPKIFQGFSDISVILNSINSKTGLVTFHGHDVAWGLGWKPSEYDLNEFRLRLIDGMTGEVNPSGERKTVRSGSASGKLVGGNIMCLLKLAGTPYWPDCRNSILFMEGYTVGPDDCDYMFHQLEQMGIFEEISGAVVGYVHSLQNSPFPVRQMEDILLDVSRRYDFPILKINDFGHECRTTVLPVGAMARIDTDEKIFSITERCLA
ncbi:MAG: LD-carboxypeptidase [Candidatus Thermoplasmatota archaeon]|nr:LD-carboxypeptidase [Candidatus Thermoplasmatota archaeon]